jgi:hypothetical protein
MLNKTNILKVLSLALTVVIFAACSKEDDAMRPSQEISDEVKAQFTDLGFDVSDIKLTTAEGKLDPTIEAGNYLLEGDIMITPEQLKEMVNSELKHTGANGEQYRTYNLVSGLPRTIRVMGYTGGGNALDNTMRTALQMAVDNYNALNIGLNFTLTFGTNYSSYDIVVYKGGSGAGGSAGFPSGGNPHQMVNILSGTSSYGTNVTEHVITHEIGHCLGFRHSDYFNRSISCGSGGNEGSAGVGAVHIPGTPSQPSVDYNSIMLSCFSASATGEFSSYDKTALEYMY